jgi:hypothetical protein
MTVNDDMVRAAAKILAAGLVSVAKPIVQAAPALTHSDQGSKVSDADSYSSLFNGFNALVKSAITDEGRTLDSLHFDGELHAADRTLLEQIRQVFIEAQAGTDDRRKAAVAWSSIEAKLHQAVAKARGLGVSVDFLDSVEDNIALAAEAYVKATHKGPAQVESNKDYEEFARGVEAMLNALDAGSKPDSIQFGPDVSDRHRQLLEALRQVFILVRTEGRAHDAVAAWNKILADLRHVFERAEFFNPGSIEIGKRLDQVHNDLIEYGAYKQDHRAAVAQNKLANPTDQIEGARLKEAVHGLEKASELVKKGEELGNKAILQGALEQHGLDSKLVGALYEYAHGGFEITELLEEWKKKGLIGKAITVADLADKVTSAGKAAVEAMFTYIKQYAEKAAEGLAEEAAKEWESVGKWADEQLEALEKFSKVATYLTVAVSVAKVINHLIHGRIKEAAEEALSTAIGVGVGAVAGAGGTALLGGIALGIAVELDAFKSLGAMYQYARVQNMKDALERFWNVLSDAAGDAQSLVADLKVLAEATDPNEKKIAESNIASSGQAWNQYFSSLVGQLEDQRKDRLGGQPELKEKLGSDALTALSSGLIGQTPAEIGTQIKTVFAGANNLARWLASQSEEKLKEQEEEEKKAEEEEKE